MRRDSEAVAEAARQRLEELAEEFAAHGYQVNPPGEVPVPSRHARSGVARPFLSWQLREWRVPGLDALERRHLGLIAAVAIVGVLLTWVLVRPGPAPVPVVTTAAALDSDRPAAAATSPAPGSPSRSPATPGAAVGPNPAVLVVDVAGKVRTPGVHTLAVGARVIDALRVAGGAYTGVDLSNLNLARPLTDGEQIVVGRVAGAASPVPATTGPGAGSSGSAPAGAPLSLTSASLEALEALPGIGPVTAQNIVAWRTEHGRFSAVEDLLEVDGIGPKTLARIAPAVVP